MKKKIFFFDIDETLLRTRIGVPQSAVNAIRKLRENGHLAFINTGRSMGNVDNIIRDIGFDGYVAGCGSYLEINGKIIKNLLLSDAQLELARDIFINSFDSCIIYEGPELLYYDEKYKDMITERCILYPDIWNMDKFRPYVRNQSFVNKLGCLFSKDTDKDKMVKMTENDFQIVLSDMGIYCDLMQKGLTKALGIKEVLDYYKMDMEDTVAFGDSNNDLEMIETVGLGIAMGNACSSLKNLADYCTKDLTDDGIEFALNEYGFI